MRFGIKTAPQHTTWIDMLDVWRAADDIEIFESAWNFDHFYPIFSDSTGPCLEGWTMLAAMAQATRRIRIGCQVTGMIYRHPAVLANMAATIDIISNGRLEVGLGAGWNQEECDAYGISLPPLKERFDRFDEGVEALVGLLSQETSTLDGKYVQLREARCEPKPVQRPHPPIAIGGNGPTRTLRTVARFAQQWNSLAGIEQWPAIRATLHQRCAETGRDPATIECSVNLWYDPTQDVAALADGAAAFAEAGADIGIVYLPTPHTPSVLEPIAEALRPLVG
jgi:F420-dependent oxidoreductase-like protein